MVPLPDVYRGPALVDLQMNGYAGFDFNGPLESWTPEALHVVRTALNQRGVGAALPTLITNELGQMIAAARRWASIVDHDPALLQTFPLLHIEGPFISPEDGPRGVHPLKHCRTPESLPDFFDRIREASGNRIGILTLAPELPDALPLIERAAGTGVCVALGHTAAAPAEIDRAVQAGARMSTHLGNGSHLMLHRHDNYIQYQLADDRLAAGFIADGHHIPFPALKNFIRAKTIARSVLVTDAIAAADGGPGPYRIGGLEVVVSAAGRVSERGSPFLAGSALTLDRAVLNVVRHCGIPFEQAWAMASRHPARLVGLADLPDVEVRVAEQRFTAVG